jgi:hypothetical protein
LEVCSCQKLLKFSGFVGEVDRNNDNKYFLFTQESPKVKCCIFHRVRSILCFATKLNLELANYFFLLKLLSFDFLTLHYFNFTFSYSSFLNPNQKTKQSIVDRSNCKMAHVNVDARHEANEMAHEADRSRK